jgi:hypothetical protein
MIMRATSAVALSTLTLLVVLVCNLAATGEDIVFLTRRTESDIFRTGAVLLTEAQTKAVAKVNSNLDLDGHIDAIECPFSNVLVDIGTRRSLRIAVDADALKKAGVSLDQFVTLQVGGVGDVPLRKCLHDLLDPLKLVFLVCPDGLLVTAMDK